MAIDHVGIEVPRVKFDELVAFYLKVLAPLNYVEVMRPVETAIGMGENGIPDFWVSANDKATESSAMTVHVAFTTKNREVVDKFYELALQEGAKDNGKPGIRAEYHPNYYAAFVIDAAGNNLEVVCHEDAGESK
ncbi:hypothetical protein W97_01156 [Coniosporium apollinis CBS 100218]|uniref:VOC domain-containing protein n=1 Tax=Coniosporium apollinis (strain CBS 100218) TaxID=1168221 RepID=R7YJ78_CONA1|nr:uncharacterized protein W97_01156 [Coniosporium apollinis CBS 100218]EON61938.1 hypothetical protein W97_01156 [Coniosporium apollinis CBS 100218]